MLACDLLERLIDFTGSEGAAESEASVRKCSRAIQDTLRLFPGLHRWTYHYTWHRFHLVPLYNTGTIEYDATTRVLTLTDGVWPSWAADGNVRINDIVARVQSRTSNSVIVLSPTVGYDADIDAGTEYTIYQDEYILPADYLASASLIGGERIGSLRYVHPSSHLWNTIWAEQSGRPTAYTIVPSKRTTGRFAVMIYPFVADDETVDFWYQRRMRAITYTSVQSGTVSGTADDTTITGTGTAFTAGMVGATIRLSLDGTRPTGPDGNNPAYHESVITAVTDANTLEIESALPATLANVAYMISDPLDLEEGTMATAFCWQAMASLATALRMKDSSKTTAEAMTQLTLAREADSRSFALETAGPSSPRYLSRRYMPQGADEA